MTDKLKTELEEVKAISLATFAVTTNTLRVLRDRGLLSQDDLGMVLASAQATLETSGQFDQPMLHTAHQLIASLAQMLSVPFRKPN